MREEEGAHKGGKGRGLGRSTRGRREEHKREERVGGWEGAHEGGKGRGLGRST